MTDLVLSSRDKRYLVFETNQISTVRLWTGLSVEELFLPGTTCRPFIATIQEISYPNILMLTIVMCIE